VEVARRQLRRVRQLLRVSTPSRRIDSAPPRVAASAGGVVWAAGASEAPHGDPGCCNGQRIAVFLFSFLVGVLLVRSSAEAAGLFKVARRMDATSYASGQPGEVRSP
jgi:hypothetical protein